MKHVIDTVDELLEANVNVTVYNGQLDLIVPTMGEDLFSQGWVGPQKHGQGQSCWASLSSRQMHLAQSSGLLQCTHVTQRDLRRN